MATEDDILKSLIRIEQALRGSTATTGLGRTPRGGGTARGTDERNGTKVFKATIANLDSLNDASSKLTKSFTGLSKTVLMTRGSFTQMNRTMRALLRGAPAVVGGGKGGGAPAAAFAGLGAAGKSALGTALVPLQRAAQPLIGTLSSVRLGLITFGAALAAAADQVVTDFFELHARGIDATSSLGGLYVDAIRAGMGLKEYVALLEEAGPAVVRAGNFDEFNKAITATNTQLAGLGIFGEDASKLSAQMRTSAIMLGVPMDQLNDATTRQVKVFGQLRKTSLLTAEGLREMVITLRENEDVQGLLLGTARSERAARLADISQTYALGEAMGLTKEASKELGAALLAQRKLTVEQRFRAAGGVLQMAAAARLDPGQMAIFARLIEKPIARQTVAERKFFVEAGGQFMKRQEELANSIDTFDQTLSEDMAKVTEAIQPQLKATGKALLAVESREVTAENANEQLGKGASALVVGAGKLLEAAEALSKNPIAGLIGSALGAALGVGAISMIGRRALGAAPGLLGGAAGGAGAAGLGGAAASAAGRGGLLKSAWGGIKGAGGFIMDTVKSFASWVGESFMTGAKALFKGGGLKVLSRLLKGIPIIGTIASMLLDGIGEAFTGEIDAAFNPQGGTWFERIGNTVFAAFNGVFGGIAGLIDSAAQTLGFEGLHLENAWEKFVTFIRGSFFSMLANISEAVAFGIDNKVSKYFRDAADSAFRVYDQLSADQTATMSKIGEKNKAIAKATRESVNVSAGVITSTQNLATHAINVAKTVSTEAAIATPAQVTRPGITPPAVNTPVPEPAAQPGTAAARGTPATEVTVSDLAARLGEMVVLLQQTLEVEKLHSSFTESILRATGRPVFSDVDAMANRVIRPVYGD